MMVLERMLDEMRKAAVYNRHDQAAPRVVLWPDGERLWAKVIPVLQEAMPEFLVLDSAQPDEQQGPSTWIRYRLARGTWDDPPVVYLPGLSRQVFRGAVGFPEEAKHLYALQFQGQFWTQLNGKDWTPFAFLTSAEGGLGLDVARDNATLDALNAQLENVLRMPLTSLGGHRLEAADFHALAAGDPIRLLLSWIGDPEDVKKRLKSSNWKAFAAICRDRYGLDPDRDGVITAVEKLATGGGVWDQVWERYSEAPTAYNRVRRALDLAKPKDLFDTSNTRLPGNNRREEDNLRKELTALSNLPKVKALESLGGLAGDHKTRAGSVWAKIGEAPLACAALHLGEMVDAIQAGGAGHDWQSLAKSYVSKLWVVDAAVWKALAPVRDAQDLKALIAALRTVYLPWLEELTGRVASLGSTYPNADPLTCQAFELAAETVLLFVDGLRCDVALELQRLLEDQGLKANLTTSWAALPTVTGTAKYAWRPLAERLTGEAISETFEPQDREKKRPLSTHDFRKLLSLVGCPFLAPGEIGEPSAQAWTEVGSIDHYGHDQGTKLAWRIDEELRSVGQRIHELVRGGWRKVVVVTDHGWLLVPGGLPKVDLPRHLTVSKWGRCALAQPGAQHGYREVSWFWGAQHSIILAPGISVFKEGLEYTHGGLSLQEALTPCLTVTVEASAAGREVRIGSFKWVGLRLRVTLEGASEDLAVDLRTKPADANSSVISEDQRLKAPDAAGQVSLRVDNDSLIGSAAVLIVLLRDQVILKQPVTIGED
jgi:hypothetical protein